MSSSLGSSASSPSTHTFVAGESPTGSAGSSNSNSNNNNSSTLTVRIASTRATSASSSPDTKPGTGPQVVSGIRARSDARPKTLAPSRLFDSDSDGDDDDEIINIVKQGVNK